MPVSEEVMEMLVEQTAETVWGLERDSNGVIIRVQHHSPLDRRAAIFRRGVKADVPSRADAVTLRLAIPRIAAGEPCLMNHHSK